MRRGQITLANATAKTLFGAEDEPLTGYNIADILPTLRAALAQAQARPQRDRAIRAALHGQDG